MGSSLSTIGHSMFVHLWILKLQELVEGNFFFSQVMTITMTAAPTTNNNNNDRLTAFDPGQPG